MNVSENGDAQVLQHDTHFGVPGLNVLTMEMYCNLREFLHPLGMRSYCTKIRHLAKKWIGVHLWKASWMIFQNHLGFDLKSFMSSDSFKSKRCLMVGQVWTGPSKSWKSTKQPLTSTLKVPGGRLALEMAGSILSDSFKTGLSESRNYPKFDALDHQFPYWQFICNLREWQVSII